MRLTPWIVAGGLTFGLCALPLFGQPGATPAPAAEAPKSIQLPLTRVVLFNAGIGYYERSGTVDGPAKLNLKVNEEDINDLILTLMVNDPTGTARAVTYDNRAPAEITLKAFSIDLTENPSVGNLLHQVRGEKVEITDMSGSVVAGNIVSVIKPDSKVVTRGNPGAESNTTPSEIAEQVSLLTDDGLQSVSLAKVKKVKFTKPELQAEFRKALEALANARGAATKSVGISFPGKGARKVSVGYVAEAPLWKPTYRLMMGETPKLIGVAAVENTTDDDWENVKMKLVSGRPMTYKMDLYDPLFIPRPMIELELYASLKPPMYQGAAQQQMGGALGNGGGFGGQGGGGQLGNLGGQLGIQGGGQGGFGGGGGGQFGNLGAGGGFGGGGFGGFGNYSNGLARPSVRSLLGNRIDHESYRARATAPSAPAGASMLPATAGKGMNLGESFEYSVLEPVSLPRFKSALLPILNEPIELERISLFTESVLTTHPLKGLRMKNISKQYIAQGPVAVFEGDTVAGQARLADIKPGETRLLSYAIDLDVKMTATPEENQTKTLSIDIVNGKAVLSKQITSTHSYTAHNRSTDPRVLWISQSARPNWKLISPAKAVETTLDLQRFELKAAAGATAKLAVVEQMEHSQQVDLQTANDDQLFRLQQLNVSSIGVQAALQKIRDALMIPHDTDVAMLEEQTELKEINEAQARIRSNMSVTPTASELHTRYLKKFDEQEVEIEKRQAKIKVLTKTKEKMAKDFKAMVNALNAK